MADVQLDRLAYPTDANDRLIVRTIDDGIRYIEIQQDVGLSCPTTIEPSLLGPQYLYTRLSQRSIAVQELLLLNYSKN